MNNIGNYGVKCISKMKQLTYLDISYNQVGEEGIKCLKDMKGLKRLEMKSRK